MASGGSRAGSAKSSLQYLSVSGDREEPRETEKDEDRRSFRGDSALIDDPAPSVSGVSRCWPPDPEELEE